MNYTQITAHIIDQSIQLANLPLLASGGVEEVRISCSFCSLWNGLGKSAVFYRKDGPVYHIPLIDDTVVIPWEVMAEPGVVYFGIMGTNGTTTRTTEVLRLSFEQGALSTATAEHEDPDPDIYAQILAAFGRVDSRLDEETAARKAEVAVERARIDHVVAMRSTEGATVFSMTADGLTGTITTNGAAAFVECIPNFTLPKGEYANFYIPAYLAPMVPVEISYDNASITCTVRIEDSTGRPMISFYNGNSAVGIKLETKPAIGSYSLASLIIPELGDVRVDADGTTHESAGAATRSQFTQAIEHADDVRANCDSAFDTYTSPNLLNKETMKIGYCMAANGTEIAVVECGLTDYIPVNEGDVLAFQGVYYGSNDTKMRGFRWICAFDAEKNVKTSKGTNDETAFYTVPSGVSFVRVSLISFTGVSQAMIHLGTDILPYEPYGTKRTLKKEGYDTEIIKELVAEEVEASKQQARPLALPPKLYGFVGYPISVYFRNVMDYNPDSVYIRKYGAASKGKQYADRWEYTPTAAETVAGAIHVFDADHNRIINQDIPVEVKDSTTKASLKVLVIGDSTVNAGQETQKMLDLAAADGYNLTLLGTRGSGANKHEGRAGWKAVGYVQNDNPFRNPETSTFDFAYYMAQQGYDSVDCVFLQLGINDMFAAQYGSAFTAALDEYITNMEIIVNSIRAYDANVKVVINLIIPCGVDQDAFAEVYGMSQTTWRCKKNTYEANIALLDKFKGVSNVYLSPYNAAIDSVNNLPTDVHPNAAGYAQLGTQMYSYMRAIN